MSSTIVDEPRLTPASDLRLEKSIASWRSFFNAFMTFLAGACTCVAMLALFSVLYALIVRGMEMFSLDVFRQVSPPKEAGFGNALQGTFIMVGLAAAIAVPLGILVAIYLSEFSEEGRIASVIRFSAKVLTGIPSILAGVFAYGLVVLAMGKFSAFAGGVALAILMLPVVILTAEEALKQVPRKMREAAFGLGCTRTQVVLKIVVPTATPGLLTGIMLAVARAAGETAPLLFTALYYGKWFRSLTSETASMSVFINNMAGYVPGSLQVKLAWTASLVLVAIVLGINILCQLISARTRRHQR